MNAFDKRDFENPEFLVQVIACGSYVDTGCPPKTWLISCWTLRLNWYALNGYLESWCCNTRECYETEEEWQAHKAEMDLKRAAWERRVLESIGLGDAQTGYNVAQITSEVFGVTYMREI